MDSFRSRILPSIVFVAVLASSSAQAQSNSDYAGTAALARDQGKIHLIYFYNSTFHHPERFADLLEEAEIPEAFIVTNLNVNDDVGRALAEAFYARSQFVEEDQLNAVLIIEKSTYSRGISVLGPDPDQIDSSTWDEFFVNTLE